MLYDVVKIQLLLRQSLTRIWIRIRMDRMGLAPWIRIRKTDLNKFKAQLAIYAPMIYMAPCVMLLMRAASIMRASGKGVS